MKTVYRVYTNQYNQGAYFLKEFWDEKEANDFARKKQAAEQPSWYVDVQDEDVEDDYLIEER